MSNDVVSETAAWYARIAAARAAGIELEELSVALGNVVSANYFGVGCEEGDVLYARLSSLVTNGARSLMGQSSSAYSLEDAAKAAFQQLLDTDATNATAIPEDGHG